MPSLMITRPAEDAAPLQSALQAMHIDTITAPLMVIEMIPGPALDLDGVQGLLVTSANGARAVAARSIRRDLPVYAVGDATAKAAQALGFEDVHSANGDVDDLAGLVTQQARPEAGVLYHAAASAVAGDLAGALAKQGFQLKREVLYEARAVEALSDQAVDAIRSGDIDGIIVYSPRTAHILDTLMKAQDLTQTVADLRLFALSRNVNDATDLPWKERLIAARPCQESLLDVVQTCYY